MDRKLRLNGTATRRAGAILDEVGMEARKISRAGFWWLQCLGWLGFCIVSVLSAIPLREGSWVYVYYVALSLAGFFATLPLRWLCRLSLARSYAWPRIFVSIAAACYALAIPTGWIALYSDRAFKTKSFYPKSWHELLVDSLADSISTTILFIAWSGIYFGMKQWQAGRLREERLLRLEMMAREAELRALRYEVTPHFLFNTLNGISTLVGEGDIRGGREMIALLGDFLRTTLESSAHGDVTLSYEMRHMEQYLAIEQVRLGDNLRLSVSIDPAVQDAMVPNLLLQPLIENAIRHGVAQCTKGGTLEVRAFREKNLATISVSNSVERHTENAPDHLRTRRKMGLDNTRSRLTARYGEAAECVVHQDDPGQWKVILRFPYEEDESSNR